MSVNWNAPFGKGWRIMVCNNLSLKQEDINEYEDDEEDSDEESYDEIADRENRILDRQERDFNF